MSKLALQQAKLLVTSSNSGNFKKNYDNIIKKAKIQARQFGTPKKNLVPAR